MYSAIKPREKQCQLFGMELKKKCWDLPDVSSMLFGHSYKLTGLSSALFRYDQLRLQSQYPISKEPEDPRGSSRQARHM